MQSHRHNGAMLPGTTRTMRELEAPAKPGYAFLGGTGWIGIQCACGMTVSGRTLAAVQAAITEHQEPATCHAAAQLATAEDPNLVDDEA